MTSRFIKLIFKPCYSAVSLMMGKTSPKILTAPRTYRRLPLRTAALHIHPNRLDSGPLIKMKSAFGGIYPRSAQLNGDVAECISPTFNHQHRASAFRF